MVILLNEAVSYHRRILRGLVRYLRIHPGLQAHALMGNILHIPEILPDVQTEAVLGHLDQPTITLARERGWKAVNVAHRLELVSEAHSVINDDEAVGQMAAKHLLDKGLRHFAVASRSMAFGVARLRGFCQTLAAAGFPVVELRLFDARYWQRQYAAAEKAVSDHLQQLPRPLGIFATEDDIALRLLIFCQNCGLTVPEEVAIVGANNDDTRVELAPIGLSSVVLDEDSIGYQAAALVHQLLVGQSDVPRQLRLPPLRVAERQSTNLLLVGDPLVARTLGLFRQHLHRPTTLDEILDQLGTSRSTLEKRFREVLGRSPYAEFLRQRLERAKELLISTDLKIEAVALTCGFSRHHHFTEVFHDRFGCPPRVFREQARQPRQG